MLQQFPRSSHSVGGGLRALIARPTFCAQHGNARKTGHGNANKQELTTKKTRKSASMSHAKHIVRAP